MRDTKAIIEDIRALLDELGSTRGAKAPRGKAVRSTGNTATSPKGAVGAILMLFDEKFFDTPKELSAVMESLKGIGHYHKQTAVAMNLLNLTKRRVLNRFKNDETKNWEYVIRK